jgi:hypothetical protein
MFPAGTVSRSTHFEFFGPNFIAGQYLLLPCPMVAADCRFSATVTRKNSMIVDFT